eukprot:CCRYP_015563-RB/>CCRYP_015563-RB protein AED:0.54 eAED:0.45 QI:0/-1/0/1/-1/0/1/0/138
MASSSETEIASLFYRCKEAIPLRITLEEMGHPQPGPTTATTDNSTAVDSHLKTMIPKASKSMDMCFQWLKCQHAQSLFKYLWAKGTRNRADYPSKHHSAKHHMLIRPPICSRSPTNLNKWFLCPHSQPIYLAYALNPT